MSELLLELFYEEIPSLMQISAEEGYKEIFIKYFQINKIKYQNLQIFSTPRRITIYVNGLDELKDCEIIEFKGPKLGAPDKAIEGFCKSHSINKDELSIQNIGDQEYYFYIKNIKEQLVSDLLVKVLPCLIKEYTWPKSMYWGSYNLSAIRPLKNILCIFNNKTLIFKYGHLTSNNITYGHRFMSDQNIIVNNFLDYKEKLEKNYVVLDRIERKEIIKKQIKKTLDDHYEVLDIKVNNYNSLLEEVIGLVEWPVVMIGKINQRFINLPEEILVTTMRTHQKYFSLVDSFNKFAPYFLFVSNLESHNKQIIIEGNERVLEARLSDALYFYEIDKNTELQYLISKLDKMNFHAKLGSMKDKIERLKNICEYLKQESVVNVDEIKKLSQENTEKGKIFIKDLDPNEVSRFLSGHTRREELAIESSITRLKEITNIDYNNLLLSANICKYDLVSSIVNELPELQGVMGYYFALNNGYSLEIAEAVKYHYNPQGPSSNVPLGIGGILAIVDKIDSLVGLMLAGEIPTGTKDPFALRRAALGIIRIILANDFSIDLIKLIRFIIKQHSLISEIEENDIVFFLEERIKNYFKKNYESNLILAIVNLKNEPDLKLINVNLVDLKTFLATNKNAKNLIEIYKRVSNIIPLKFNFKEINKNLFTYQEEKDLYNDVIAVTILIDQCVLEKESKNIYDALLFLITSINKFFDKVMINDKNSDLSNNRLALLYSIKLLFNRIVNFDAL